MEDITDYERKTYEGRLLCDSRSSGYCGSCSIEVHVSQIRDPESWVQSSKDGWFNEAVGAGMEKITCRGSVALGTACGKCSKCIKEAENKSIENITKDFTVTPDGNMTYHGDKPVNANMIFNPGDSLVRAVVEDKSESCGANESLVNLNPKLVEPVEELVVSECTYTISDESKSPLWIVWEGGERPVDGDSEVAVKLRNGDTMIRRSTDLSWAHCPDGELDSSQDIIAYRPSYPEFLENPMKDDGFTDHELDESECDAQEWVDGLPPVGTVCEITHSGLNGDWVKVEIATGKRESKECDAFRIGVYSDYHFEDMCEEFAWLYVYADTDFKFRPIKSPKEKAIEEMVKDIRFALDTYQDDKQMSEYMYNLGYRIQENGDG